MSIIQTYHTIVGRLKQIVSRERITRIRTMAWLQSGMLHSRSVHLNRIASKIPGKAKKLSRVRQLEESVSEIGRGSLTASWRSFFCVVGAKVGGWKQKMGLKASQRRKK